MLEFCSRELNKCLSFFLVSGFPWTGEIYTLWLYIIYNIPYFLAILAISDHETHHWDAIAPTLKEIGGREHELWSFYCWLCLATKYLYWDAITLPGQARILSGWLYMYYSHVTTWSWTNFAISLAKMSGYRGRRRHTASQKIIGNPKLTLLSSVAFKMVGRKLFGCLLMFMTSGVQSPLTTRCTKPTISQKIPGVSKFGSSSSVAFKKVGRNLFGWLLMFVTLGVRPSSDL